MMCCMLLFCLCLSILVGVIFGLNTVKIVDNPENSDPKITLLEYNNPF